MFAIVDSKLTDRRYFDRHLPIDERRCDDHQSAARRKFDVVKNPVFLYPKHDANLSIIG